LSGQFSAAFDLCVHNHHPPTPSLQRQNNYLSPGLSHLQIGLSTGEIHFKVHAERFERTKKDTEVSFPSLGSLLSPKKVNIAASYRVLIFLNFDLEYFKGVQISIVLHAQIYLITNGLGGRQAEGTS
jgi:hypothetical protein